MTFSNGLLCVDEPVLADQQNLPTIALYGHKMLSRRTISSDR